MDARTDLPPRRLGCVSFINSKPLIEGFEDGTDPEVRFAVPAMLLEQLETGSVDIALCPVIDYHRSAVPLTIIPAGGIGCRGTTLTVRLFSRVPIAQVREVHTDCDSHTSVALMQVLLNRLHGLRPKLVPCQGGQVQGDGPETMLLIGDKVVTASPRAIEYPYQLDLGETWHEMTGQPFLFAVWMARPNAELGDLPARLARQREINAGRIDAIARRHAGPHGWPLGLTREYLGQILRYKVGPEELQAADHFARCAAELGLIERVRPIVTAGLEV